MKHTFTLLTCILIATISFSQSTDFENYRIIEVGSISIPNNMEIQSGNFKKLSETYQKEMSKKFGYEVSDNRIVFQQKGLNDLEKQGFASYVRVILETEIGNFGDFDKLTNKLTATPQEISEISKEFKNQFQKSFAGTSLKLITWYGVSIVTINGRTTLKLSYLRQLDDKPYVVVNMYRFQNNDRFHSLTLSYIQSDEATWKPLLTKIANSFTITNVR
ncbi:MAG: hypothetical protein U0V04_11255 [Spirosomataceae bacterium]